MKTYPRSQYRFFQQVCLNENGEICVDDELKQLLYNNLYVLSNLGNEFQDILNNNLTAITSTLNVGFSSIANNINVSNQKLDDLIQAVENKDVTCNINFDDNKPNQKPSCINTSCYSGKIITFLPKYSYQPIIKKIELKPTYSCSYVKTEYKYVIINLTDPKHKAKIICSSIPKIYSNEYCACIIKEEQRIKEYYKQLTQKSKLSSNNNEGIRVVKSNNTLIKIK